MYPSWCYNMTLLQPDIIFLQVGNVKMTTLLQRVADM